MAWIRIKFVTRTCRSKVMQTPNKLEEHCLLTVCNAVVSGKPAMKAAWRHYAEKAKRVTSISPKFCRAYINVTKTPRRLASANDDVSNSFGSTPKFLTICLKSGASIFVAVVLLNHPLRDLDNVKKQQSRVEISNPCKWKKFYQVKNWNEAHLTSANSRNDQ